MRPWIVPWIALGLVLTLLPGGLAAEDLKKKTLIAFMGQTRSVRMECFPPQLRSVLADLRTKFGRAVIVTSGARGAGHARRGSLHRSCRAADIRIPGVSAGAIAKVARANAMVGGVGTYCGSRTGLVHVDVGPKRSWIHCGRRSRRG